MKCQDCDARATRTYHDGRDGDGPCVAHVCELDGAHRDRQRDEFYAQLDASAAVVIPREQAERELNSPFASLIGKRVVIRCVPRRKKA